MSSSTIPPSQPQSMNDLPPIYILPTHLQQEQLHQAEDALYHAGGRLTYRASEARIFLGKVLHKKRAAFDLRAGGVWTREESLPVTSSPRTAAHQISKRRRLNDSHTEEVTSGSETESDDQGDPSATGFKRGRSSTLKFPDLAEHVVVLKLEWLDACNENNKLVPFEPYLVYSGKIVSKPESERTPPPLPTTTKDSVTYIKAIPESRFKTPSSSNTTPQTTILERAKADKVSNDARSANPVPFHRRKFGQTTSPKSKTNPPKLHRATTSENKEIHSSRIPPPPTWTTEPHPRPIYSCLRDTPPLETNPNRYFIKQLERVKEIRQLTMDEIGVRAYSTAIASLRAYSHRIISPLEITRLAGCSDKIAALWKEWHESVTCSDTLSMIEEDDNDDDEDAITKPKDLKLDPHRTIPPTYLHHESLPPSSLPPLLLFHNIWGVGPETARKFHYTNGWHDLDDIIEFGWSTLTRSQQIGLKFHDEFQLPIPRSEVETIARVILHHARTVRDIPREYWSNDVVPRSSTTNSNNEKKKEEDPRDFICAIVGSYRRGSPTSSDVDVIISHRDRRIIHNLILDLVRSLESTNHITHTLTLDHPSSSSISSTPSTSPPSKSKSSSFDNLDKALCVWQDPNPNPDHKQDGKENGNEKKNTNPHRRVDIIISPWTTIGCAVLGWSGGTTFQRDLRRWVKREKGWKFDSSGVRDRVNDDRVLDLENESDEKEKEGEGGEKDEWELREKRVMERLGIGWREPGLRCTG